MQAGVRKIILSARGDGPSGDFAVSFDVPRQFLALSLPACVGYGGA